MSYIGTGIANYLTSEKSTAPGTHHWGDSHQGISNASGKPYAVTTAWCVTNRWTVKTSAGPVQLMSTQRQMSFQITLIYWWVAHFQEKEVK